MITLLRAQGFSGRTRIANFAINYMLAFMLFHDWMKFISATAFSSSVLAVSAIAAEAGPDSLPHLSLAGAAETGIQTGTNEDIWIGGIGEGFAHSAESLSFNIGGSGGVPVLGGQQHHDLAFAGLTYGHMLGNVLGDDHWWRGNFEWRWELFSGAQVYPYTTWLVGLTPHLRYNFATGSRWVPFIDVGAGISGTGIGAPDLSGTFEFNVQGSVGTYYFLRKNLALSSDVRLLHMSCAGISSPNLGLNTILGTFGVSWFF